MARDRSGDAGDPVRERAAAERAGRKRLGANGRPQTVPTPATPEPDPDAIGKAADAIEGVVPRSVR